MLCLLSRLVPALRFPTLAYFITFLRRILEVEPKLFLIFFVKRNLNASNVSELNIVVDVLGMIVEYDCSSFTEFVCRLSLEPNADPNEPGTERFKLFTREKSKFRLL